MWILILLKGNRQIGNRSSINTNGDIKDHNDGNLGLCCFFLCTISKLSTDVSGSEDHKWTCRVRATGLDYYASSPANDSPSRMCSSLPFGGDCKGEFNQMFVAMGIRVRKRAFQWKLVSQHKTLPFRYDSLWVVWGPSWK